MAHRVISLLRSDSVAFVCEADMRTIDRSNQSDVNDPTRTSGSRFCCDAQRRIRPADVVGFGRLI